MLLRNNKLLVLVAVFVAVTGSIYSLPPYSIQSYAWWLLAKSQFEAADRDFANSGLKEWEDRELRTAPNIVTTTGKRLYFIGSIRRFGRQYDIAYTSGESKMPVCTPISFYAVKPLLCDLPLNGEWNIHYESVL